MSHPWLNQPHSHSRGWGVAGGWGVQVSHPWQSFAPDVLFLAGGQDTRVHTLRLEMDAGNAVSESLERNVVQLHVLFRAAFGTAGARASPVRRGERERIVTVRVSGPWKATPADFRFPGECGLYSHVRVRCESLGFVPRSRAIFSRPVPNLSVAIRNFCIAALPTPSSRGSDMRLLSEPCKPNGPPRVLTLDFSQRT